MPKRPSKALGPADGRLRSRHLRLRGILGARLCVTECKDPPALGAGVKPLSAGGPTDNCPTRPNTVDLRDG